MAREGSLMLMFAALAGASLWLRGDDEIAPRIDRAPAAAPPVAGPEPVPVEAPIAPPAPTPAPSTELELPDGSRVPALNGATDPAPLARFWGTQVPWSPIVGVERNDKGIDWYRHENGSYSTTQMVWRADLKRYDAMTRVAHQGPKDTPSTAAGK